MEANYQNAAAFRSLSLSFRKRARFTRRSGGATAHPGMAMIMPRHALMALAYHLPKQAT
jgi:hypothetical protein